MTKSRGLLDLLLHAPVQPCHRALATVLSAFFAVMALLAPAAQAQTCTGDRDITSQATLDAFAAEGCTSLSGNLRIQGSTNLTSLSGLGALTSIGQGLIINGNAALTSLAGLDALNSVGWFIDIRDNDALASLAALGNLTSVGIDLFIRDNAVLTSLAGLDALTSIGRNLNVSNNAALTASACALKGLATQTSPGSFAFSNVSGTITIDNNGGPSCGSSLLSEMAACTTNTAVEGEEMSGFALQQAVPSPTANTATIRFSLAEAGDVRLSVYDVLGREVARLVDESRGGGAHDALFDGASLPSGVYIYRLTAGRQSLTGTLTVAR